MAGPYFTEEIWERFLSPTVDAGALAAMLRSLSPQQWRGLHNRMIKDWRDITSMGFSATSLQPGETFDQPTPLPTDLVARHAILRAKERAFNEEARLRGDSVVHELD